MHTAQRGTLFAKKARFQNGSRLLLIRANFVSFVSPIHLTAPVRPMQGNASPVAAQVNKAFAQVETNFINLPKDNQGNNSQGYESRQMKESIQPLGERTRQFRQDA
jgi:hypothetical protein